eukprot:scaffold2191_cov254-Pinguiococcus_pyrenoidosus.AAC.29
MSHGSGNESSDDDGILIEQETVSHLLAEAEANDLISEDVKNELEKLLRTLSKGNVQSSSLPTKTYTKSPRKARSKRGNNEGNAETSILMERVDTLSSNVEAIASRMDKLAVTVSAIPQLSPSSFAPSTPAQSVTGRDRVAGSVAPSRVAFSGGRQWRSGTKSAPPDVPFPEKSREVRDERPPRLHPYTRKLIERQPTFSLGTERDREIRYIAFETATILRCEDAELLSYAGDRDAILIDLDAVHFHCDQLVRTAFENGLDSNCSLQFLIANSHASSCRELLLTLRTQFSDPDTSKDVADDFLRLRHQDGQGVAAYYQEFQLRYIKTCLRGQSPPMSSFRLGQQFLDGLLPELTPYVERPQVIVVDGQSDRPGISFSYRAAIRAERIYKSVARRSGQAVRRQHGRTPNVMFSAPAVDPVALYSDAELAMCNVALGSFDEKGSLVTDDALYEYCYDDPMGSVLFVHPRRPGLQVRPQRYQRRQFPACPTCPWRHPPHQPCFMAQPTKAPAWYHDEVRLRHSFWQQHVKDGKLELPPGFSEDSQGAPGNDASAGVRSEATRAAYRTFRLPG